ncbi:hypothetical protein Tco_1181509, partial [Tanacetum coccineum]
IRLKKQSTSSVHLSNISDDYVAFKFPMARSTGSPGTSEDGGARIISLIQRQLCSNLHKNSSQKRRKAKSTISSLTYQNSIIIEAKETLQLELIPKEELSCIRQATLHSPVLHILHLDRRSKKGFSLAIVCMVSLIGIISGYISDP